MGNDTALEHCVIRRLDSKTGGLPFLEVIQRNETVSPDCGIDLNCAQSIFATAQDLICVSTDQWDRQIIAKIFLPAFNADTEHETTHETTNSYPEFPIWTFDDLTNVQQIDFCAFSGRMCIQMENSDGDYSCEIRILDIVLP